MVTTEYHTEQEQVWRTTKWILPSSEKANAMKEALKPFQKIIVAYDDSLAARDALSVGIELCKQFGVPLQTITVVEPPPAYTGLVLAIDPSIVQSLESDRRRSYESLMEIAVVEGRLTPLK